MGAPLRVLLVTDWMPAHGGAEAYASALRAGLTAVGIDVRLLTSSAGTAAQGTAEFVAFGTQRPSAQAFLQVVNPFAVRQARAAVRAFHPDVALVHLFAYHLSPAVLWALGDVPLVMTVLDYKIVCPLGSKLLPTGEICHQPAGLPCWQSGCLTLPHWLRDQARYGCISAALERVQLVLACSHHVQRELLVNDIESEFLHLPVAAPGPSFRRQPADHPQFVFSGRVSVEKGVPLLIRAFAQLHARVPRARLRIVGDGPLRGDIERAVAALDLCGVVTFTGWLDPAGVDRQLEDAWALVAPSIWAEPFGMVAPEAIMRGVPVIASRTGGFSETVEDEVSGLLFSNGDEHALTHCLERVALGLAFPSHRLDEDVITRGVQTWSMESHVSIVRGHLEGIAGRARKFVSPAKLA